MLVFLTLVIAVVNVCVGFALAMHLGYGPPSMLDVFETLSTEGIQSTVQGVPESTLTDDLGEVDEVDEVVDAAVDATRIEEALDGMLDGMLDEEPEEDPYDEPYQEDEAEEEEDSAEVDPDSPHDWDLDDRFIETSILKLNIAMMKSGARATEIDTRLRQCKGHSDLETIRQCLEQLKEDCQSYLAEQSEAAEKFHDRIDELGELSSLGEEIEMANLEQAAQIETTLSNLQHMDFESDLEAANRRLLEEINHLRTARHKLRDSQEAAFLVVARYENRIDKIEKRLYNDPVTGLYNRIGLETTLFDWWGQGRHKSRQMSAVLFDLDAFGKINEQYGSLVADQVLHRIARLVEEASSTGDLVARYAGQRFFVMMVDVGPRAATKTAELLRQSLEKVAFVKGEERFQLTTAGGLTEVTPEDTHETLFARLEEALSEAKTAGPNRSFFHDGREAQLIESPNLGADFVEVKL